MSITFKIHYITIPGQVLLIKIENGDEIPLEWTEGHYWIGTYEYEAPKHYVWSYIVRNEETKENQRYEEVIGRREHLFTSKAQVRDWWYYPWLTEITEEPILDVKEEKEEKIIEEEKNEKREESEEKEKMKSSSSSSSSEEEVEMTKEEIIILEKKKEKELKVRLCGSENNWDLFRVWTGKACCEVLYDSTQDEFTAKAFNECVGGRSSVILFIHAQNYIFGSYTAAEIPEIESEGCFVLNDRKSFAFSFQNPYDHAAIRYICEDYEKTLQLFDNDDEENVVAVRNFFTIKQQKDKCYISADFEKSYDETSGRGANMFMRAVEPDTFEIDELIAVKLTFNKNGK